MKKKKKKLKKKKKRQINKKNMKKRNTKESVRRKLSSGVLESHEESEINPNTEWMNYGSFWIYYFSMIFLLHFVIKFFLWLIGINSNYSWTIIHFILTFILYFVFHYNRGVPFWMTQDAGKYDNLTFWEQIDSGRQYTFKRKVLIVSPIIIFFLASWNTQWDRSLMSFNFVVLMFALLPKLETK